MARYNRSTKTYRAFRRYFARLCNVRGPRTCTDSSTTALKEREVGNYAVGRNSTNKKLVVKVVDLKLQKLNHPHRLLSLTLTLNVDP